MRIIAGTWGSRRIVRPRSAATRPMPDRVKEAIFSMLGAHFGCPGSLPPLGVADVFAGGGTMGLEALSRGASRCVFFERDRLALAALGQNISALDAGERCRVVRSDAWISSPREASSDSTGLIFLDPPYKASADASEQGPVRRYLAEVASVVPRDLLVALHHEAGVSYDGSPAAPWRVLERRHFGSNGVTFFVKHD